MPIIKSVVKKTGKNGDFWICVIDGEEVLAFDSSVVAMEGKECPHPILPTKSGDKKFIAFPKAGGFQKSGGGWKGKSDKEIYAQIFTMCMAYAKDHTITEMQITNNVTAIDLLIERYRQISQAILADLAKVAPAVPVQTEAPKTESKAPEKPPQDTSPPRTGTDKEAKTVKEKLEKKMWQYLANQHADNDQNFKALLMELTEFQGTNKQTGEPEKVFVDNMAKLSEKWAGSCMGKMEKLIEEEERKNMANAPGMEDVPY